MPGLQISSFWQTSEKPEEIRGRCLFRSEESKVWNRCVAGRAKESLPGLLVQEQLYSYPEEAEGLLLVQCTT